MFLGLYLGFRCAVIFESHDGRGNTVLCGVQVVDWWRRQQLERDKGQDVAQILHQGGVAVTARGSASHDHHRQSRSVVNGESLTCFRLKPALQIDCRRALRLSQCPATVPVSCDSCRSNGSPWALGWDESALG